MMISCLLRIHSLRFFDGGLHEVPVEEVMTVALIAIFIVPVACPVFKRQGAGLGRERQVYTNTYYLDHCPDYCGRCFCTDVRTCQ